eukprot:3019968-Pyramimonas_sp.AAC.2
MFRSTMTPCLNVWPCAACAVAPKAGASGNCRLLIFSRGRGRPLSTNNSSFCGATGYKPGVFRPPIVHPQGIRLHSSSSPSSNSTRATLGVPFDIVSPPRVI